VEVVSFIPLH